MKSKIKYTIAVVLFSAGIIFPQINLNKTAQSTMNFLLVSTSPKASGMGEAFTAVGTGAEGMFYNPAGLTGINSEFDINIGYTKWIADINYLSGAAAWNLENLGVVGVSFVTVDYGVINGTSLLNDGESELYPMGFRDNGEVSNVGAYAIGVSYAKAISREFSIGGTIKLAGQNLGENIYAGSNTKNNAAKLVFDAGVKYSTDFNGFRFGMYIRNFSSDLKREEIREQLPLVFSVGAAINLMDIINKDLSDENTITAAVDFLHQNNYSERVNAGLEYLYSGTIALRGGYQSNRDIASWSAGAGINTMVAGYKLEFNYSYSAFDIFNDVNRLSLTFSF